MNGILSNADYFILVLFRVAGLVIPSPIFGRVNIPTMVKVCFSAALTLFFFAVCPPASAISYNTLIGFALACALEVMIGVVLAFVTNLFFTLTYTGGHLIDMQIGFGIVNVYDPQNNTQVPMVGNLMNIILLIVFWGVDGHHKLLNIIYRTFEALPPGNIKLSGDIGLLAVELFAKAFMLGVMVALPVIASGLILEIGFGVLMRTVPQLHMFVIGIPLKLLIGMILLLITLPVFVTFSDRIFTDMFNGVEGMLGMFAGA